MPEPLYALNESNQFFKISYYDGGSLEKKQELESGWKSFKRRDPATTMELKILCRPTNRNMEVAVDHMLPPEAKPGKYRVETFVPGKHATARKAIFTVFHNFRIEENREKHDTALSMVDMLDLYDVWHSLGEFQLDPATSLMNGCVRQFDLSLESPPAELAFGPVRWVPLFFESTGGLRYDSPVGTQEERDSIFPSGRYIYGKYPIWTGDWFDVNPYLSWYEYGYHTGADLNLPGASGADKGKPIYAVADGKVTYAGKAGSWGYIIVIEHPDAFITLPEGKTQRQSVFSRYGHVDQDILVRTGQEIPRGFNIGSIGLPANQVSGWHLHFDISYSDILRTRPAHWPNISAIRKLMAHSFSHDTREYKSVRSSIMREVIKHYLDPFKFLRDNHGK
jgi:murein DD-endopeptidase MepM/ murein hydrolase activator NlpD